MKIIYLHQYFNTPDMPGSTPCFKWTYRFYGHDKTRSLSN